MKISPKKYALALLAALENKNVNEAKTVIKKMAGLIINNNDQSKINEIISVFSRLKNKQDGIIDARIISARAVSKDLIANLEEYIAAETGAKKIVISEEIDKDLLGGVVLKYGDKVLDLSLKYKLEQLKNNLIK